MPLGIWNLEWLSHNAQRAYPLVCEATKTDLSGEFVLPEDFIVSLYLPVHWANNVDPGNFYVSKIAAYETGFSVVVGYSGGDGDFDVASAQIARVTHTENQVYNLGGLGDFADSRGHIVIGDLSNIDDQPTGLYTFDLEGTRLEPDAVRPHIRGVMALQADNGGELSDELYGNIRIQAGKNARITPQIEVGKDPVLVFDAIEGEGLTEDCVCDDEDAPPLRTINGIPGDGSGNFTFLGNDCIDITAGNNAVTFEDVCSEPCCGCKELEVVTRALEAFGEKATTLENFLVSLEARVTQMDMVVLGSRTGDRGCAAGISCPPSVE